MNCCVYGCNEETKLDTLLDEQVCSTHGVTTPIVVDTRLHGYEWLIQLRYQQMALELDSMCRPIFQRSTT